MATTHPGMIVLLPCSKCFMRDTESTSVCLRTVSVSLCVCVCVRACVCSEHYVQWQYCGHKTVNWERTSLVCESIKGVKRCNSVQQNISAPTWSQGHSLSDCYIVNDDTGNWLFQVPHTVIPLSQIVCTIPIWTKSRSPSMPFLNYIHSCMVWQCFICLFGLAFINAR